MSREIVNFGKYLKEYRENLHINQTEAAYMLGILPNTYSNYERCERPIPMHHLPKIKEVFDIPDELFLDMLLDRPRKKKKESPEEAITRLLDMRESYIVGVTRSVYDMVNDSGELRQLLGFLQMLDDSDRRPYLIGLREVMVIYGDMVDAGVKAGLGAGAEVLSGYDTGTREVTGSGTGVEVDFGSGSGWSDNLTNLIQSSAPLQTLIEFIASMDAKKRRIFLNGLNQILKVYDHLFEARLNGSRREHEEREE
nr:helix-turn-helix transcriptional regulator [Lysinibacillus timonensis]